MQSYRVLLCVTWLASVLLSCAPFDEELDSYAATDPDLEEIYRRENVRLAIKGEVTEHTPTRVAEQIFSGVCRPEFGRVVDQTVGLATTGCDYATLVPEGQPASPPSCRVQLCRAWTSSCVAHQLLDMVALPTPVDIGNDWIVPPQSTETRAALAREALTYVRASLAWSGDGLATEANNVTATGSCNNEFLTGMVVGSVEGNRALGEAYAATFLDGYELVHEIAGATSGTMRGVAESQMASTSDDSRAAARAQTWPLISAAALGHFLLGGNGVSGGIRYGDGFAGSATPLCDRPPLSPDGSRALDLIRASGISPDDLLQPTLTIDGLVASSLTNGSVSDRLADYTKYAPLGALDAPGFYAFTRLRQEDFVAAREHAVAEHTAFARSIATGTAVEGRALPADRRAGGTAPQFLRYASTAQPPRQLPHGYFGARMRDADLTGAPGVPTALLQLDDRITGASTTTPVSPLHNGYARKSVADLVDFAATRAYALVSATGWTGGPTGSTLPRNILAYAGTMFRMDREARAEMCYRHSSSSQETIRVRYFSYLPASYDHTQVRIVRGAEGLRCATEGTVEGSRCRLSDYTWGGTTAGTCSGMSFASGFPRCYEWNPPAAALPEVNPRFFIVRPRSGAAANVPGNYQLAASFRVTTSSVVQASGWQYCDLVPYVRELEESVDDALSRSPANCSDPARSCTDLLADYDLVLENELTSDGDEYEDSWRAYLDMAGDAARHADELADQVIATGLANDERMERAAERLEDLCGANVSVASHYDSTLTGSIGAACTSDATCSGTAGARCHGGLCVRDPYDSIVSDPAIATEERNRLQRCLGDEEVYPFVNLGTRPSCVWYPTSDPNAVCEINGPADEIWERHPCPWLATRDTTTGSYECNPPSDTTRTGASLPAGYSHAMTQASAGLFSGDVVAAGANPPCEDLRRLRRPVAYGLNAEQRRAAHDRVIASGFFEVNRSRDLASRIGFEAKPGDFAAVTFDGVPWVSTGDYRVDPLAPGAGALWPCATQDVSFGCGTGDTASLFCASANCATVDPDGGHTARATLNTRLLTSVIAARMLSGAGMRNVTVPFFPYTPGWPDTNSDFLDPFQETMSSVWGSRILWTSQTGAQYRVRTGPGWFPDYWRGVSRFACTAAGSPAIMWTALPGRDTSYGRHLIESYCLAPSGSGNDLDATYFGLLRPTYDADSGMRVASSVLWSGLGGTAPHIVEGRPEGPIFAELLARMAAGTFDEGAQLPREIEDRVYVPSTQTWNGGHTAFEEWRDFTLGDAMRHRDNFALNMPVLTDGHLADTMELVCEAGRIAQAGCDPTRPPLVQSVEDLPAVRSYLRCVANSIEQRAATTVFANVPRRALDAVRDSFASRTSPALGGDIGTQTTSLGRSMNLLRDGAQALASGLRRLEEDIERLEDNLALTEIRSRRLDVEMMLNISNQMSSCAQGLLSNFYGGLAGCAGAISNISLSAEINRLSAAGLDLEADMSIDDFASTFASRSDALASAQTAISDGYFGIHASLQELESTRSEARRELARAVLADSDAMGRQYPVNTVYRRRHNTAVVRYEEALINARRLAHLARRAIEQRLAVDLRSLDGATRSLGLVDAPSEWIDDVCLMSGIDYTRIRSGLVPIQNYADGYIGDYVRKLELLVEGYRLAYPFSDSRDVTVLSLRDEIHNVRRMCEPDEIEQRNLLAYGENITHFASGEEPGWHLAGCLTDPAGENLPDCFAAVPAGIDGPVVGGTPTLPDGRVPRVAPYRVWFGSRSGGSGALTPSTRVYQTLNLPRGRYRLSWYGVPPAAGTASSVQMVEVTGAPMTAKAIQSVGSGWERYHAIISVHASEGTVPVTIELRQRQNPGYTGLIAGLMLEDVSEIVRTSPTSAAGFPPGRFWPSGYDDSARVALCEDTTGEEFRSPDVWHRDCIQLCPGGFGGSCATGDREADARTTYCYWETQFSISQSDIEEGRIVRPGGIALGNFNYRLDETAINFVGTGTRVCTDAALPSTCHSSAYIPYTLDHLGPYPVRNHIGATYLAPLTAGHIEHGRGLAAERYITNPISSADETLMRDYVHRELRGRPLTGRYRLRVWDVEGVNFEGIEDVQLVLKYRYWTRFE